MSTIVGTGTHRYRLVENWPQMPDGWTLGQTGVATDSSDRVFAFNRSEHPIVVFDRSGKVLESWGEGWLNSAHGIYIDADDHLYLPVIKSHIVHKCDLEGRILLTLGTPGTPSNPECSDDQGQWLRDPPPAAYGPFTWPTDVTADANGVVYVSDGYGNASVHRFSSDGDYLSSWGAPGRGAGQFHLPHSVAVQLDGRILVADRHNNRIQIFDPFGVYLDEWTDLALPCDVFVDSTGTVFVAEGIGGPWSQEYHDRFISIFSAEGDLLARWSSPASVPGHAIWVDSEHSIYVGQHLEGDRLLKYERV